MRGLELGERRVIHNKDRKNAHLNWAIFVLCNATFPVACFLNFRRLQRNLNVLTKAFARKVKFSLNRFSGSERIYFLLSFSTFFPSMINALNN